MQNYVLFDLEGKVINRANTIPCMPEDESWDIEALNALSEVPWGSVGEPAEREAIDD